MRRYLLDFVHIPLENLISNIKLNEMFNNES